MLRQLTESSLTWKIPEASMVSSYVAYKKKTTPSAILPGQVSLQNIVDYAENHRMTTDGTMQTDIVAVKLLGRKRRRGRQPHAAPPWEYQPFDIHSPVLHPQQEQDPS